MYLTIVRKQDKNFVCTTHNSYLISVKNLNYQGLDLNCHLIQTFMERFQEMYLLQLKNTRNTDMAFLRGPKQIFFKEQV
jgi:hypothetical protein